MGGGAIRPNRPLREPISISIRPATKDDLDAVTWVAKAGFPDDPGCNYRFLYRHQYPDDFWKWTRLEYEEFLNQSEKFAVLAATVAAYDGVRSVDKPVAVGQWDVAVKINSTGGGKTLYQAVP